MNKYITNFTTTEEFNTSKSSLKRPHVSLTKDDMKVHYMPYDPYNGHAYVEIGGLKWATMNVGATNETDYGLYFQWGDTKGYTVNRVGSSGGKKAFKWTDYKYSDNGSSMVMAKYNSTDGKTVLDIEDDAVRSNWGGAWRIPTTSEIQSLGNAVNAVWTTNYNGSGVNGLLCTDKNDETKTLFFPAAGLADSGSVDYIGSVGYIWSSSLSSSNMRTACNFYFNKTGINWDVKSLRNYGLSVRGVVG